MRVVLPVALMERCRAYGRLQAHAYASGLSSTANSSHGIERDPERLAVARMGECAGCVALDVDPLTALDWSRYPDPGFDLRWFGNRIDFKTTQGGRLLIYPAKKAHLFDDQPVDIFVLVLADPPLFEVAGWRTKAMFKHLKAVSLGMGLDRGTWWLGKGGLQPIEALLAMAGGRAA